MAVNSFGVAVVGGGMVGAAIVFGLARRRSLATLGELAALADDEANV